jgi:hypothetical protein
MFCRNSHNDPNYPLIFNEIIKLQDTTRITELLSSETSKQEFNQCSCNTKPLFSREGKIDKSPACLKKVLSAPTEERKPQASPPKLLVKTIKRWNLLLETELEKARYNTKRIRQLHEIVYQKIFITSKTSILQRLLEKYQIKNQKLDSEVQRMILIISKILQTPRLEGKRDHHYESEPFSDNLFGTSAPSQPLCFPPKGKFNTKIIRSGYSRRSQSLPEIYESSTKSISKLSISRQQEAHLRAQQIAKKKNLLEQELLKNIFKKLGPQNEALWEHILLKEFSQLQNADEVAAGASVLNSLQAMHLLQNGFNSSEHWWKLPYLLGSLTFEVFQETLYSFSCEQIAVMNARLKKNNEYVKQWMDETFKKTRQSLIDTCNLKKDAIDKLTRRFRVELNAHEISPKDVEDIKILFGDVSLHFEGVNKFRLLLADVTKDPQATQDFADLDQEYQIFLTRLKRIDLHKESGKSPFISNSIPRKTQILQISEGLQSRVEELKLLLKQEDADSTRIIENVQKDVENIQLLLKHEEPINGCVYEIIYNNAFTAFERADNDDAYESLGDWSICSVDDYKSIGLLGSLPDADFERMKAEPTEIFKIGFKQLRKLGIEKIADWKRLEIYNKQMLAAYLYRTRPDQGV